MSSTGPDMRVNVAGVELVSPVIAASGTFGYGVEFEEIVSFLINLLSFVLEEYVEALVL